MKQGGLISGRDRKHDLRQRIWKPKNKVSFPLHPPSLAMDLVLDVADALVFDKVWAKLVALSASFASSPPTLGSVFSPRTP